MTKTKNLPNKSVVVIKVGGDVLLKPKLRQGFAANVKGLINDGWQCVILHGGGPQLNELQRVYGLTSNKVAGRRITRPEDLQVVKQALCGEVNVDLVSALVANDIAAFGCHGASARLIQAVKRPPVKVSGEGDRLVDFGEVGDVISINQALLRYLLAAELVPVIASLGVGGNGRIFNINADTTVSAIASALQADLLILCTMVGGVFGDLSDPSSRVPKVTPKLARQLIATGVITDGMVPKVEEAIGLLSEGIGGITIVDAKQPNNFTDIADGKDTVGTRVVLN